MYYLESKSDKVQATQKFLADTATYGQIKYIRSEQTLWGKLIRLFLAKLGSDMRPKNHTQKSTAKQNWHTLFDVARCMLTERELLKEFVCSTNSSCGEEQMF